MPAPCGFSACPDRSAPSVGATDPNPLCRKLANCSFVRSQLLEKAQAVPHVETSLTDAVLCSCAGFRDVLAAHAGMQGRTVGKQPVSRKTALRRPCNMEHHAGGSD